MTTLSRLNAPSPATPGSPTPWPLIVLVLDQLSKAWILYGLHLADLGTLPLLPFFRLSLVWNRGFSFGLLSQVDLHAVAPVGLLHRRGHRPGAVGAQDHAPAAGAWVSA